MKKRLLATLLALCLAVGLLPATALAEGETDGATYVAQIGSTQYTTLSDAVAAVPTDGTETTITLLGDISRSLVVTSGKNIVLDLNGHTIDTGSYLPVSLNHGTVTLRNGTVRSTNAGAYVYGSGTNAVNYSVLNIESSAKVEGYYGIVVCGPTYGDNYSYGSIINIEGTVNGVIFVSGNMGNDPAKAIQAENLTTINVNGTVDGTSAVGSADTSGIAMNGYAVVNVYDGASITGREAIGVKRGVLNVYGGTLIATGAKVDPAAANHNGTEATGAAISITSTYNNAGIIDVNIYGGNFNSTNNSALYMGHSKESDSSLRPYTQGASVNIANGNFNGASAEAAVYIAEAMEGDDNSYTKEVITGGTFSSDIRDYLPSDAALTWDSTSGKVVIDENKEAAASVNGIPYTALQAAIDAAPAGATIDLLKSITVDVPETASAKTGAINITKNITINGNGNTITAGTGFTVTSEWDPLHIGQYHVLNIMNGADVTLKNLTVDGDWDHTETDANAARSGINVYSAGTVTLDTVTVQNCSVYGVVVNGSGSTVNATSLTTSGNRWGVNADNSGTFTMTSGTLNEEASLVIEGGTSTVNGGTFLGAVGVKDDSNGTLTVKGGSFASSVIEYVDNSIKYEVNNSGRYTYYPTLDKALAAAGTTGTITSVATVGETTVYTVTLSNNGDTKIIVKDGETITLPAYANTTCSAFVGWLNTTTNQVVPGGTTVTVTENVTYVAQWQAIYYPPIAPTNPSKPTTPEKPEEPDTWVNPYTDVSVLDWFYDEVAYVSAKGLMTGTTATTFLPNADTSRAMIWTVLGRMVGENVEGGSPWYAAAQAWAVSAGVSDGTEPNSAITREQLVTMLYRQAGSPAVGVAELARLGQFTDGESVSDWAEEAMAWAVSNGILTGDGDMLKPQGSATRAQVAAILARFCENIQK